MKPRVSTLAISCLLIIGGMYGILGGKISYRSMPVQGIYARGPAAILLVIGCVGLITSLRKKS
jgi:hypothetical protein